MQNIEFGRRNSSRIDSAVLAIEVWHGWKVPGMVAVAAQANINADIINFANQSQSDK